MRFRMLLGGGCAALLLLSGCLHSPVERQWGEAYEALLAVQTMNPGAPRDTVPMGLDAATAERVADRYYEGQELQETRRARGIVIGER